MLLRRYSSLLSLGDAKMYYKLRRDIRAFSNLVPMVLAIVIVFSILFIKIYVNGAIDKSLRDTYPDSTSKHNAHQNTSLNRLGNVSDNQDSTIDIVQVVIIITVLASAIAAIFLFTRFR